MFYAAKPRGRRTIQGRFNNASNHPDQAQSHFNGASKHPNRVRSCFYAGDGNPDQVQTRFRTASKHPNRAKIAQMALSTAPIKPEWVSQTHPIDLPIIRSNTFPEK